MDDRTAEIIAECKAIIDAIERKDVPLSRVALKARRLAQLLDDDVAFTWLSMECVGADGLAPPARQWADATGAAALKGVERYLKIRAIRDYSQVGLMQFAEEVAQGKIADKTRVAGAPLAELEAEPAALSKAEREQIAATPGGHSILLMASGRLAERRKVLERIAASIHEWATGVYIVHRFRQAAGNIFERFKTHADAVLAHLCPEAIGKLDNAVEKADSGRPEDWAAAALSCRRVLHDFADAVYPSRDELVDGRSVTKDKYKNRLWAFAKEKGNNALEHAFLADEEITALCKTLDRVYELDSKGVHADVTREEAHLAVLKTYILLEQLAQLVPPAAAA